MPLSKDPKHFRIGWICATETEFLAAQLCVDEEYSQLQFQDDADDNNYFLGRIGNHDIVIASLPFWDQGLTSAAGVAKDMIRTFQHLKFGLMVGVGGGAPTDQNDIRLGDVVVSAVDYSHGAVFQYDFGQQVQGRSFEPRGFLGPPPKVLKQAVGALKTSFRKHGGNPIDKGVSEMLESWPHLQEEMQRPDPSTDVLFKCESLHSDRSGKDCLSHCGDDCVERPPRSFTKLHFGVIASANSLMKDALLRDKMARDNNVLCFEMEAAGLVSHFKCLVIRGISDYADSHKNESWQGYAALAAAVYAKHLINIIVPSKVQQESSLKEAVNGG